MTSSRSFLSFLRIRGFALIDELELALEPGLTVITGETGAGKSILVEALGLMRGERASVDAIRTGEDEAHVEGVFTLAADDERITQLKEAGHEVAQGGQKEDGLLVRRIITRSGRNRIYMGGSLATVAELTETIGTSIDITSQHDQQSLMDPESQLAIVDAYADNRELLARMRSVWGDLNAARSALEAFDTDQATRAERQDFLRFQLQELVQADLKPGEDQDLATERNRIKNAERFATVVARGEEQLYSGDAAAAALIAETARSLASLADLEPRFGGMAERLDEAHAVIEDVARDLGRYGHELRFDPARLEEIEDRLYVVSRLCRKHDGSIDEVLAHKAELQRQLDAIETFDESLVAHRVAVDAAHERAVSVAAELGARRRDVARKLGKGIDDTLRELGLRGARVEIEIESRPKDDGLGPAGRDRVAFLFSPNKGEQSWPLHKIASGGELSRVMLAVKRALAHADRACTYVFDEVDAGVGGAVAEVVGLKLKAIAADRQVLTVTHLPQIAAFADHHLRVEKVVAGGRTVVKVVALSGDARRDELARMLAGSEITPQARAHADDMLVRAVTHAVGDATPRPAKLTRSIRRVGLDK